MKKYIFMAVAAIAALSSCSSDNDYELNKISGKQFITFTATMEGGKGNRAILNYDEETNKPFAEWVEGDKISINENEYTARNSGSTATFEGLTSLEAVDGKYKAYFPANLFHLSEDDELPPYYALPEKQTYTNNGTFNMPMYAEAEAKTGETNVRLQFKNLCAVLAIKVTRDDIYKLKSIKVESDKKMNGKFTVLSDKASLSSDDNATNVVVLESEQQLTLTEGGTTFYIAIPAREYKYFNIFLSSDGVTYKQAMATKSASGPGTISRNTIYNIDYQKNATKLWEGKVLFADANIPGHYCWGGTHRKSNNGTWTHDPYTTTDNIPSNRDTATKLWGSNWRMPKSGELSKLKNLGTWDETKKGLQCKGTETGYTNNSVFLPADGIAVATGDPAKTQTCRTEQVELQGYYWASSKSGTNADHITFGISSYVYQHGAIHSYAFSVRPVLEEN